MSHFVITANRLTDGQVIFQTANATWSETISDAELIDGKERLPLALERAEKASGLAVGPYEVPVDLTDSGPVPLKYRERLRLVGPSITYLKHEAA